MAMQRTLLTKTLIALILGLVLVVVCYFVVDRPVAWFVHSHRCFPQRWLLWPPWVSGCVKTISPLGIIAAVVWWAWRPGGRLQTVLLAISADLVAITAIKLLLKWGCGRTWPESWPENHPSLIADGVYGFHPFHWGAAYDSFPSGHAAVICSVAWILWMGYPRWCWWCAAACLLPCAALVGMNYHFVGDVVAGVILGCVTGAWVARLFRVDIPSAPGAACVAGRTPT